MAVPNAPTDLNVTATAVGELYLTWVAPVAGDAPTGYTIYYGTETAVYTGSIDAGDVLEYTVDSLGNGDTYFYKVFAYNGDGESATGTDEVSETTLNPPGAPTALVTSYTVPNVIDLAWTAPVSGGTPTGYVLYSGSEEGIYTGTILIEGVDTLTYQFTGTENEDIGLLGDGETVYFKITAVNGDGESAGYDENTGVTMDVPYVCTDVEVVSGTTSLIFSWTDPVFDGGSEILLYNIYTGSTEGTIALTGTAESIANDYSITGLAGGVTRFFQVSAVNAIGEGELSTVLSGRTLDVPYVCTDVEVVSGTTSLIFSWTDPVFDGGSEVLYYNIYTGTTEGTIALTGTAESIANDYSITRLAGGVTRFFQVSAVNAIGEGELSTALSGRTLIVPGTPTGLTDVDGNTIVTLSWTPPEEPGEPLTTHYNIYRGVETGVLTLIGTVIRTETTYSDTGLTNGTTYFYAVSAVNTTGEGELTSEITATPEAAGVNQVSNRNLTACGAINISVFELTNGHSWTLDIPSNKTVFGIIANFTTNSNLSGTESILISTEDMMVKVYDGDTESIDLFDVTAVVYYK